MAVSKEFLAELVAEIKADKIAEAERLAKYEAEIAEQIANGEICGECFLEYCECY